MKGVLAKYRADCGGATAIEYSLIVAGVALAVSVFIFAFGEELYAFFDEMTGALDGEL